MLACNARSTHLETRRTPQQRRKYGVAPRRVPARALRSPHAPCLRSLAPCSRSRAHKPAARRRPGSRRSRSTRRSSKNLQRAPKTPSAPPRRGSPPHPPSRPPALFRNCTAGGQPLKGGHCCHCVGSPTGWGRALQGSRCRRPDPARPRNAGRPGRANTGFGQNAPSCMAGWPPTAGPPLPQLPGKRQPHALASTCGRRRAARAHAGPRALRARRARRA
jgi:hypothetical protein